MTFFPPSMSQSMMLAHRKMVGAFDLVAGDGRPRLKSYTERFLRSVNILDHEELLSISAVYVELFEQHIPGQPKARVLFGDNVELAWMDWDGNITYRQVNGDVSLLEAQLAAIMLDGVAELENFDPMSQAGIIPLPHRPPLTTQNLTTRQILNMFGVDFEGD